MRRAPVKATIAAAEVRDWRVKDAARSRVDR